MEKAALLVFQFFLLPVIEVLLFLLPLILLGALVRILKNRIDDILFNDAGRLPYYFFAALGTPVHELSHLIACLLFRHQIRRFSLFFPDKSGRLGYVEHLFDPGSLYQRIGCFFIGLAPIAGGGLVLYFFTLWLYPGLKFDYELPYFFSGMELKGLYFLKTFLPAMADTFVSFFRNLSGIIQSEKAIVKPLIFLLVICGVGSHSFPSPADFKGMAPGAFTLYGLVCLAHLSLYLLGLDARQALEKTAAASGFVLDLFIFITAMLSVVLAVLFVYRFIRRLVYR